MPGMGGKHHYCLTRWREWHWLTMIGVSSDHHRPIVEWLWSMVGPIAHYSLLDLPKRRKFPRWPITYTSHSLFHFLLAWRVNVTKWCFYQMHSSSHRPYLWSANHPPRSIISFLIWRYYFWGWKHMMSIGIQKDLIFQLQMKTLKEEKWSLSRKWKELKRSDGSWRFACGDVWN